ncbi:MAG: hypothetical protein JHD16_02595 [Solirubrobacteraceae bacterium]|nr:hypothetical protein [Solirubrobacteraceae bacterium]
MSSPRTTWVALAATTVAVLAPATAHAAETIKLDLRSPANATQSDAAAQSQLRLVSGGDYVLTISGTGSIWDTADYAGNVCGSPEPSVIEPSPGAAPVVGSWDAATVFAAPRGAPLRDGGNACEEVSLPMPSGPNTYSGFEFSTASTFVRGIPVGGIPSAPRADHTYNYALKGTGVPLRLRFDDRPSDDNSGVFTVLLRTRAECEAVNCLNNVVPLAGTVTLPPASGTAPASAAQYCNLDRVLSTRLVQPKGKRIVKAAYYLGGKYQRSVTGRNLRILSTPQFRAQKFRALPSGTLKLRVVVTTSGGKKMTGRLDVSRCMPRIKARVVTFI